jgi:hypothetical protein
MARTPFKPTDEQRMQVSIMASCGFPHELMVERIINHQTGRPIDKKTLYKAFRVELDQGLEQANAMVAQSLFKKAIGTSAQSVTAAIWWEKTRAGKKDTSAMELTGKDGTPLHPPEKAHEMTDAELESIARSSRSGTTAEA